MVPNAVVELVFKGLVRKRRTSVLWNVWFFLFIQARRQFEPFDLSLVAASLDISRGTVRRSLRVLAKLGLILPVRAHASRPFDAVYVRSALGSDETDMLAALAAGTIEIAVDTTAIIDRLTGQSVDRTNTIRKLLEMSGEPTRSRRGVLFLPVEHTKGVTGGAIERTVNVINN